MSIWTEAGRGNAQRVAQANGWKLVDQSDGRLAFESQDGATRSPIIFTGNEEDLGPAITRAASAMMLQGRLKTAIDTIATAANVTKAVQDGKAAMSLAEKMARLAERSQSVPKALEARADALLPRLDALEKTGGPVFDVLENVVADAEKGVAAAEAAMRQLTNGGPLSGSGGSQSGA